MAHLLSEIRYESVPPTGICWHEYADLFPWIEGKALDEFREDIRIHGVVEPIVFLDGAVLDGRNRYMAARELGVEYPRVEYLGDDPLGFVVAKNTSRRHLSESQRAMIAARIADMRQGARTDIRTPAKLPEVSQAHAASMLNVSERTLRSAKVIQKDGSSELVHAVEEGRLRVASAADLSTLPVERQIEILKRADPQALRAIVKETRDRKQAAKKARRVEREAELAKKQKALPDEKFGLILADPEWRFKVYGEDTGMDRSADNHYPTSDLGTIMARDVGSIAAKDCILLLWVPVPMIVEAICVADAWGFCWLDRNDDGHLVPIKDHARYVSHWAWLKEKIITGYWNRGKHEILLIFTRGNPVAPAMGEQLPSWIEGGALLSSSGEHSAKPEQFLEWIDRQWPNTPKIELNRRGPARDGWSAWGNEAEAA